MKTFHACLMAEFRRALPFLPWLLGLHAMTCGSRTRWAGEFSYQLVGMIEWTSWALAALVAVISLWRDAPLRRERFLSTRPQRFLPMLAAKWIALALIVALPFGVVDFLALKTGGISGEFLWLGTLQTLLLLLAALTALFPAVWWWRSSSFAFTALGVTFTALVTSGFFLSQRIGNRNLHGGEALGFPLGSMLVLVFLLAFAIASAASFPLFRKPKNIIRIPAFALLACLSLWIGLRVSIRPPKADESKNPSLVNIGIIKPGYQNSHYDWFHANAPSTSPDADIDVVWSFSKLEIDGRDSRPWIQGRPSNHPMTLQVRSALARRFGKVLADPRAVPAQHFPTVAILPAGAVRDRSHEIDFDLLETHYRWEVVVDMPLKAGASFSLPDSRWTVVTFRPELVIRPERDMGMPVVLEIRKLSSDLWIRSQSYQNMFYRSDEDCPCLVDPVGGVVNPIELKNQGPGVGSAANQSCRLESWELSSWGKNYEKINLSRELRFVVLRPKIVRRISHSWKSPGPVALYTSFSSYDPEPRNDKLKGTNLVQWLGKNPVPPETASTREVDDWFSIFYPLLNIYLHERRDSTQQSEVQAALSLLVSCHPETALAASENHRDPPWLLQSAIRENLPRDVIQRFPEYATNRFLMESFIARGWAGDLAAAARDAARKGLAWKVEPILLAAPGDIGLTQIEWLEYFRLNPSSEVYKALVGKVLSRGQLDQATRNDH